MKLFIQVCELSPIKIHVAYEGGTRFGTVEVTIRDREVRAFGSIARLPDWIYNRSFKEKIVVLAESAIANSIIGKSIEDEPWHEITVFKIFRSIDEAMDAMR